MARRILLLHNLYQQAGGEDRVVEAEAEMLRKRGDSVFLYTDDNDRIESQSKAKTAAQALWSRHSYREVSRIIRENRIELCHFHNTFPLISPSAYYAAGRLGVPVVQTLHNYRIMCPNALLMREGRICEDCVNRTIVWPGVAHKCYRASYPASATSAAVISGHRLLGTWTHRIDCYIALTEFARRKFVAGGLPASKIAVKANFVDPDPGRGRGDGGYALFVGRLSPEKGVGTLLEAWERGRPAVPLRIAGEGPLAEQVREAAARNPKVKWLGEISRVEVLAQMRGARFLLCPSTWYESFGLIIVEALATGLPVIASDLGALAELIKPEETGLLFQPGNADDLAAKAQWALDHPERMQDMRVHARKRYEELYTADRNYAILTSIYDRLLGPAPERASAGAFTPETRPQKAAAAPKGWPHERPEIRVLLKCVRPGLDAAEAAELRRILSREFDWEFLLREARRHAVLPLLRRGLHLHLEGVAPEEAREALLLACRRAQRRNLALTAELRRVLDALEKAGIRALPFKGPLLASLAYGDLSLRTFGDLDVLVRERDLALAERALAAEGYTPAYALTAGQERAYRKDECAIQLRQPARDVALEIHWRLTERYLSIELPEERLRERASPVTLAGKTVPAFAPEDLLLYLAIHGSKHQWERLEWLCSIAETIGRSPGLDWSAVRERARRAGVERMLHLSLRLAHDLLDLEYPHEIAWDIARDGAAEALARETAIKMFAPEEPRRGRGAWYFYMLRARERWSDRARIAFYSCARLPHPSSRELVSLPARLSFLYYIFRPARLLAASMAAVWRRRTAPALSPLSSRRGQPFGTAAGSLSLLWRGVRRGELNAGPKAGRSPRELTPLKNGLTEK